MSLERPFVLSIAGFDPSGGAGVLADIKVFEMHQVQGLGVCTSITIQNEKEFVGLEWVKRDTIYRQLEVLFMLYKIDYIKIGLIKDLEELNALIDVLLKLNKEVKIIWDPILKASAGYDFHPDIEKKMLISILNKIYMVTPNLQEIRKLVPNGESPVELSKTLSNYCMVYLKGGHGELDLIEDYLFAKNQTLRFNNQKIENGEKHGSGCILSSSLTANLAKSYGLEQACKEAIIYTRNFLKSNNTLLGYHNI